MVDASSVRDGMRRVAERWAQVKRDLYRRWYPFETPLRELGERYGLSIIRFGLVLIFIWAGLLKMFGAVHPDFVTPVRAFVDQTVFFLPTTLDGPWVGLMEFAIGFSFLVRRDRIGAVMLVSHQLISMLTLFMIPGFVFIEPALEVMGHRIYGIFDIEAIYVLKNITIIGAGIVLAAKSPVQQDPVNRLARGVVFVGVVLALFAAIGMLPVVAKQQTGVYVTDYDRDGVDDLLVTGRLGPAMFHNDDGSFSRSYTLPAMPPTFNPRRAHVFDHDNDGWDDILFLADDHAPVLLRNVDGGFVRVDAGIDRRFVNARAASADYDRDGCLDLVITQAGETHDVRRVLSHTVPFLPVADPGPAGATNYVYQGNCSRFTEAIAFDEERRSEGGASFTDLTGDGWPDIHVANFFQEDTFHRNLRNGSFETASVEGSSGISHASTVGDVDGDGRRDLFVSHYRFGPSPRGTGPYNSLLLDRGGGTFTDRAERYGVRTGGRLGGAVLADMDNDGDSDLFKTFFRHPSILPWHLPDRPAYWTYADGRYHREPLPFYRGDMSGVAALDVENDGDLDLVVGRIENGLTVYENTLISSDPVDFEPYQRQLRFDEDMGDYGFRTRVGRVRFGDPGAAHHWIQVALPQRTDRTLIGTRVAVTTGDGTQVRVHDSQTDFRAQSSRTLHFGLGDASTANLTVTWPDGTESRYDDVTTDQRLALSP